MRIRPAFYGLLLATTTASCAFLLDFDELQAGDGVDGGGATGGGAGGGAISIKDAAEALAQAVCKKFDECMPGAAPLIYGDEDCVETTRAHFRDAVLAGIDQLPADTVEYHPELAPGCIAALAAAPCEESHLWPAACEAAIQGKVKAGGACVHPAQCEPSSYCPLASACPATCTPKLGKNQPCVSGACAQPYDCRTVGSQRICVQLVGKDGECGGETLPPCLPGLLCVGGTAGGDAGPVNGTCRPTAEVFSASIGCLWSSGQLCSPGKVCEFSDPDSTAGECKDPTEGPLCVRSVPDACPAGQYCKPQFFNPPLVSLNGQCTELPIAQVPCAEDSAFKPKCAAGTRCVSGICQALLPIGQNGCSSNQTCYSGFCDNGKCAAPIFCAMP